MSALEATISFKPENPKLIEYAGSAGLQFTLNLYQYDGLFLFGVPGFIVTCGDIKFPRAMRRGKWYDVLKYSPAFQRGLAATIEPWRAEYPTVAFPQQSSDQVTSS